MHVARPPLVATLEPLPNGDIVAIRFSGRVWALAEVTAFPVVHWLQYSGAAPAELGGLRMFRSFVTEAGTPVEASAGPARILSKLRGV